MKEKKDYKHLQMPPDKSCKDCFAFEWCLQQNITKADSKECLRDDGCFIERSEAKSV